VVLRRVSGVTVLLGEMWIYRNPSCVMSEEERRGEEKEKLTHADDNSETGEIPAE
jgi:hypothetical protein